MKPVTAALLSAGATLVLAGGLFLAALETGIYRGPGQRAALPEGTGVVTASSDVGSQVRDYLAANPDLLRPSGGNSSAVPPALQAFGFTANQKMEIGALIRDYLLANPEVIKDAMEALEQKTAANQAADQKKAISEHKATIFNAPAPRQVVLGNPNGDVTLVEFFDYNCGYCRRAQADMRRLLSEDKNLRVVLKEFPVLGPGSIEAAQVAVALNIIAPEKYEAFHDKMLTDSAQASAERAIAIAGTLGVDKEKLRTAVKDTKVTQALEEVYSVANSLSLSGTPSYVLGDEVIVGAVGYDALKQKISSIRTCGSANC